MNLKTALLAYGGSIFRSSDRPKALITHLRLNNVRLPGHHRQVGQLVRITLGLQA